MTYDEIIEQLEITKSKIKEIARNEYGGESWNDDLDALTEAADIVADYSKATAQASEMSQKYEQPAMAVRRAAGLYTCPLCCGFYELCLIHRVPLIRACVFQVVPGLFRTVPCL